jgi:phospholipid/cholesterol/gamma-HCH transport system substrate-binding protein
MKDQRKTEIRVGITIVASIILFVWIFGWAKNVTFTADRLIVDVLFQSVAGLEVGDPVTVNGVRKGYVDAIQNINEKVLTKLSIDSDIKLKKDASFIVMMLDLMGGKKIEINPGSSDEPLDISFSHEGSFVGDISSAMGTLGSVQNDLVDVIREIKITLTTVNSTLTNEKFSSELKATVENLSSLTNNINKLIINNRESINSLITSSNSLVKNVNEAVTENKDSISTSINKLNLLLNESRITINKINNFIEETEKGNNNAGKLLYDPDLVSDLKKTIQQTKELTKILVEQLKSNGIKVEADINIF